MKHVFILNTVAGKHNEAGALVPAIEAFFRANKEYGTPEIVFTEAPGHATAIAAAACAEGKPVRLYACGGDGTIAEVLQGMHDQPHAQLACVPCGSGNDYLRLFPDRDFKNIAALVSGTPHPVDLIACGNAVSLNIACMGMDADVAAKMVKYKRWPLVTGPMAYNLAIADVFFHRIGKELSVTIDTLHGEVKREGRYFFALAASGQYYGGGYHGAPMARPDDGILDFVLVRAMSRLEVLKFLPRYKSGDFLDFPYVEHFRGTAMTVHCDEGAVVALDGECFTGTNMRFALADHTVPFVLPQTTAIKQPTFTNPPFKAEKGKQPCGAFVKKV